MRFGQTLSTEPYHAGWVDVAKTQHVSLLLSNNGMSNAPVVTITWAFSTTLSPKTAEQHACTVRFPSPTQNTRPRSSLKTRSTPHRPCLCCSGNTGLFNPRPQVTHVDQPNPKQPHHRRHPWLLSLNPVAEQDTSLPDTPSR